MGTSLASFLGLVLKAGVVLLVLNEIRGLILAAPVLYGIYLAGGTWTAIWLGFSSMAGIALSVIVPAIAARKLLRLRPGAPSAEQEPLTVA